MQAKVQLPSKLAWVFKPQRGDLRYRCAYGGRGSGKSFSFALMSAVYGYAEKLRILCTREFQNSVKDSFHAEVKNAIQSTPWLASNYDVGVDYIKGHNGTEFIFKGLRNNIDSIKSLSQIDICIVEESETIPDYSWKKLKPTIRAPRSEIWAIWNPERDNSPTDFYFRKKPPGKSRIVEINWRDNPWFPDELNNERLEAKKTLDKEEYEWIWEGQYLKHSNAQIFKGRYSVERFEPKFDWSGPYYGMDFGFSQDPTVVIKCWIYNNILYLEKEAGKKELDLDDTPKFIRHHIPELTNQKVIADSARPESISMLKKMTDGFPGIAGAKKGKGSVEDGISHIKSYKKVVIHPRCQQVKSEFDNYSYKKDRLTEEVTTDIIDANNHYIDALRYALEPLMSKSKFNWEKLL